MRPLITRQNEEGRGDKEAPIFLSFAMELYFLHGIDLNIFDGFSASPRKQELCPCPAASIQVLQILPFPIGLILIGSQVLNFVQLLFCNSFNAVAVAASSILNGDESAPLHSTWSRAAYDL